MSETSIDGHVLDYRPGEEILLQAKGRWTKARHAPAPWPLEIGITERKDIVRMVKDQRADKVRILVMEVYTVLMVLVFILKVMESQ